MGVILNDHKMKDLFDPGSCCSYVRGRVRATFRSEIDGLPRHLPLGFFYHNGTAEQFLGTADVLVQLISYRDQMSIPFVPSFNCDIILDHDFAEIFDFKVRYKRTISRIEDGF